MQIRLRQLRTGALKKSGTHHRGKLWQNLPPLYLHQHHFHVSKFGRRHDHFGEEGPGGLGSQEENKGDEANNPIDKGVVPNDRGNVAKVHIQFGKLQ